MRKIVAVIAMMAVLLGTISVCSWASPVDLIGGSLLVDGSLTVAGPKETASPFSVRAMRERSQESKLAQFVADEHVLMLRADGRLLGWGDNRNGQLGLGGGAASSYAEPTEIKFFRDKAPIVQIAALEQASLVLLEDGELYACGSGANGRSGLLSSGNTTEWTLVPNSKSIGLVRLYPGKKCFFGINNAKSLYACGANTSGQLGLGTTTDKMGLSQVKANVDLQDIMISEKACAIIEYDGTVWYTGNLSANPLGMSWKKSAVNIVSGSVDEDGSSLDKVSRSYTRVCGHSNLGGLVNVANKTVLTDFTTMAASYYALPANQIKSTCHSHRTKQNSDGYHLGSPACITCLASSTLNASSGTETVLHTITFSLVFPADSQLFNGKVATMDITQTAIGNSHGYVLKGGKYYGFGGTEYSQLAGVADGSATQEIAALTSKVSLLRGQGYTNVELLVNGDSNFLLAKNSYQSVVYTWGFNRYGMGGTGSEAVSLPAITEVTGLADKNITEIVCGRYTTYFIAENGDVYGAGQGYGATPQLLTSIRYIPDVLPPEPPSLTAPASAEAGEEITLSWTPGSSDTVGYRLTRSLGEQEEELYTGADTRHRFAASLDWDGADYRLVALNEIDDQSDPATAAIAVADTKAPELTDVTFLADCTGFTVTAADAGSGIKGFLVNGTFYPAANNALEFPCGGEVVFTLQAQDNAGNNSETVTKSIPDETAPVIEDVTFSEDPATASITASDAGGAGLKGISVNDSFFETTGPALEVPIGENTRYLALAAEDRVGNRSELRTERVPGWGEIVDTMTLEYAFSEDHGTIRVTAKTSSADTTVDGIFVDDAYFEGDDISSPVGSAARYVNLQAKNNVGDLSTVVRARVPGWNELTNTITIKSVEFSSDSLMATITAASQFTKIAGILVNDQLYELNPLEYSIPEGTQHLRLQAVDEYGDKSQVVTKRVPGWSSISDKVTIQSIVFSQNNSVAKITATAQGGEIKGIRVNGAFQSGNPVSYRVPSGTDTLEVQAEAQDGSLSAVVRIQVPEKSPSGSGSGGTSDGNGNTGGNTSQTAAAITVIPPSWTKADSAKVRVSASDRGGIDSILAATDESGGQWADITDTRYVEITQDTNVYIAVTNDSRWRTEKSQFIECFDRLAPSVTAVQREDIVTLQAVDDKSGVTMIYVDNVPHPAQNGTLKYQVTEGAQSIRVQAQDQAGNISQALVFPLLGAEMPVPYGAAVPVVTVEDTPPGTALQPQGESVQAPGPVAEPEAAPGDTAKKSPVGLVIAALLLSAAAVGGWYYYTRRLKMPAPGALADLGDVEYDEAEYTEEDPEAQPEPEETGETAPEETEDRSEAV